MTPERYLVLLSARFPDLGGFSYPTLDRALLSLIRVRRRWPRATLLVIPAQQGGGIIRKK
jgi:hypothetical protein